MFLSFQQVEDRLSYGPTPSPMYAGRGRSWITGLAGFSGLGPNSEPRGNKRSFPETRECDRVPVKKIRSCDLIFSLVNSTYFFKITNNNQHASNNEYLANLIKKYWTCSAIRNWQIFWCASRTQTDLLFRIGRKPSAFQGRLPTSRIFTKSSAFN